MIKNIPNKYTQSMLLEKIDIKHKDNYDFFYLPIDFTVFIWKLIIFLFFFILRTNVMLDMHSLILIM